MFRRQKSELLFVLCILLFFTFSLEAAPQRIVSIAPSFTEILFALGAGDRVVGRTNFCDYPPEVQKVEKIGDLLNPNLEKIISLRPDLVVLGSWKWEVPNKLRAVGIPVLEVRDAQNMNDVFSRILRIGERIGCTKRAEQEVSSMKKKMAEFRERTSKLQTHPSVFIELDSGNWTAGSGSYLNEVLELAGLRNIFSDRKEPYLMVTTESIAARNPDIILSLDKVKQDYLNAPNLQPLDAVRYGRILDKKSFDWNSIMRQSPRLTEGIANLIKATATFSH